MYTCVTRIAGEFCTWLRSLPGEDQSVNTVTEHHLRSLFDSGHGRTEIPQDSVDHDDDVVKTKKKYHIDTAPDTDGIMVSRRRLYGQWYIKPSSWETRLNQRLVKMSGGGDQDQSRTRLGVSQDCKKVDLSMAQLHSTKVGKLYLITFAGNCSVKFYLKASASELISLCRPLVHIFQ